MPRARQFFVETPGRDWRARVTECVNGHPLEGDNVLVLQRNGKPRRVCRACNSRRQREYYARRKEHAA